MKCEERVTELVKGDVLLPIHIILQKSLYSSLVACPSYVVAHMQELDPVFNWKCNIFVYFVNVSCRPSTPLKHFLSPLLYNKHFKSKYHECHLFEHLNDLVTQFCSIFV